MNTMANGKPRIIMADVLAAVVFLLACGVRIWGAWAGRNLAVVDASVVGLMARHMAALQDFPFFFYGQAYMGSLEPLAGAVMIRLLGPSGFAVSLGPVIFAAAALVFLWRWARDAAGPWGGLAALVAGLFGPAVYFHFQISPRGGYMVALFVDALALWAAARLAARLRAGERIGWGRYFALGLLTGLGMWSNMIVAPALLVAVLLLAHGMRGRIWRHAGGIAAGLAGFVAGFAPWLAYNLRHGWASMEMSQTAGHEPVRRTLVTLWGRFLMFQSGEIDPANFKLPLVLALAVLALAAVGAGVALVQFRRATLRENYARAAVILFCAAFPFVYAVSGFAKTHTARYWVPLAPGLALLAALACAVPGSRIRRGAAWGLLGLLTLVQGGAALRPLSVYDRHFVADFEAYRQVGEVLDQLGIDTLLAPVQFYPMNFALNERIAVSDGKQEFYKPILQRVELAEAPAYCSDYKGIGYFLNQLEIACDSRFSGGRGILWNLRRPAVALREISPEAVASLALDDGTDCRTALTDRNLDTRCSPVQTAGQFLDATFEWTFAVPQNLQAIRLVFAHGFGDTLFSVPQRIRIEARTGGEWRTVRTNEIIVPLEWSGRRVYYPSGLERLEYPLRVENAEAIRVGLLETRMLHGQRRWRLAEAMLFTAGEGTPPPMDAAAVDALGGRLRQEPPEAVIFAPRWLSNQLRRRGLIAENRLAGLVGHAFASDLLPRDGTVPADRPAVFVVESPFAPAARATLDRLGVRYAEEISGPWTLLAVAVGEWNADGRGLPPAIKWSGDAPLLGNSTVRAAAALHRLRFGAEPEKTQKALLAEIAQWRPSALSALPEDEVARLGGAAAVEIRRKETCFPAQPCTTEFANGIRLNGVEVDPPAAAPGGQIDVHLYWSAGEDFAAPAGEFVFLHLRDSRGEIVAQDDFPGVFQVWRYAALRPLPGECVEEIRHLVLPAGLPAGPLTLSAGLYHPGNGRRVKVLQTEAPALRRNAATWPTLLQVGP